MEDLKVFDDKMNEIRQTLGEMGSFLGEASDTWHQPELTFDGSFVLESEIRELKLMLKNEKERNDLLEARIAHKDQLLSEMAILQNTLYENIEDLQNKLKSQSNSTQELPSKHSDCQYTSLLLPELKSVLKVETESEILSKVQHLSKAHKKRKSKEVFVNRLSKMVQELSPAQHKLLALPDLWKWVVTLLEDYMRLKRSPPTLQKNPGYSRRPT